MDCMINKLQTNYTHECNADIMSSKLANISSAQVSALNSREEPTTGQMPQADWLQKSARKYDGWEKENGKKKKNNDEKLFYEKHFLMISPQ